MEKPLFKVETYDSGPYNLKEVEKSIKNGKDGQAPGPYGIYAELLK